MGMGIRSKRYAAIVENREVKWIGVDEKGIEQSSVENLLSKL
jgi:peroxiredoxin